MFYIFGKQHIYAPKCFELQVIAARVLQKKSRLFAGSTRETNVMLNNEGDPSACQLCQQQLILSPRQDDAKMRRGNLVI